MGPELFVFFLVMVVLFWWMSRNAKKQQQRAQEQRDAAITVGANVVTHSGFLGTIVDIDGDAVTLESPSGTETVWLRSSIVQAMDIPVAAISEEEAAAEDAAEEHASSDIYIHEEAPVSAPDEAHAESVSDTDVNAQHMGTEAPTDTNPQK